MGSNPMEGVFEVKNSSFMYNTIFVYILRVPVSMKGSKGHQKSRKQRKQTGLKELAHICVLCSAIASPSLLSSSPIRGNPKAREKEEKVERVSNDIAWKPWFVSHSVAWCISKHFLKSLFCKNTLSVGNIGFKNAQGPGLIQHRKE